MITKIVATPNMSLLDMLHSGYIYGFSFLSLRPGEKNVFKVVKAPTRLCLTHVKPVFVPNLAALSWGFEKLSCGKYHYVVLVGGSPIEHLEYGLDTYLGDSITQSMLIEWDTEEAIKSFPSRTRNLADEIMNSGEASVLQQVYPLLYRERDKDKRKELSSKVYAYLVGDRKLPPETRIGKLDELLAKPETVKFRAMVIKARETSIDQVAEKYGIDKFDITYLLKTAGIVN